MTMSAPLLPAAYRLILRETVGSTNDEAKELARAGARKEPSFAGCGRRPDAAGAAAFGRRHQAIFMLRLSCARSARPRARRSSPLSPLWASVSRSRSSLPRFPRLPTSGRTTCWREDEKSPAFCLNRKPRRVGSLAFLIVGVGLNLVSAPSDAEFPATSLAGEGLPAPTPEAALAAFVRRFEIWVRRWREKGFGPVRDAWRARAFALGEPIRVRLDTTTLHGRFIDIDQRGALLLEFGGERRRISAGDVFPAR